MRNKSNACNKLKYHTCIIHTVDLLRYFKISQNVSSILFDPGSVSFAPCDKITRG